jgi:hypothetical protein
MEPLKTSDNRESLQREIKALFDDFRKIANKIDKTIKSYKTIKSQQWSVKCQKADNLILFNQQLIDLNIKTTNVRMNFPLEYKIHIQKCLDLESQLNCLLEANNLMIKTLLGLKESGIITSCDFDLLTVRDNKGKTFKIKGNK